LKRHARILGLLSLCLAACQGTHAGPNSPKTSLRPAGTVASGDTAGGSTPGAKLNVTGSPAVRVRLKQPARGTRVLAGSISLDAGYALSGAGGTLIGDSGSTLIGDSGSTLIGDSGSTLIGDSGSTLIGDSGSTLIGDSGSTLIGDSGSTLIGTDGAVLIGDSGSTLIGDGGSTLTGHAGYVAVVPRSTGFGVLAAAPAPKLGQELPVRGALVGVISLSTGRPISLGLDAKGKGVPLVYTNAKGGFEVYLPDSITENVLIVSSLPRSKDGRLAVNQIINAAKTGNAATTDATTVLTEYLRRTIASRLEELALSNFPKAAIDDYNYILKEEPTFQKLSRARRRRVLGHLADAVLATASLDELLNAPTCSPVPAGCATTLGGYFDRVAAAAAAKLALDKQYFSNAPYIKLANLGLPDDAKYKILKPSDLNSFIVNVYIATNAEGRLRPLEEVMIDIGLDPGEIETLRGAVNTVATPLIADLLLNVDGTRARAIVLQAAKAELALQRPEEPPAALPTPLPALQYTVSTLAGSTQGRADGQGAKAQFWAPSRVVVDTDGTLYVSDTSNGRICKVTAAGLVSTIAGTSADPNAVVGGFQDGPADVARFRQPGGLALDHLGNMYVADTGNNRIRKITGYASAKPMVTTVAGDGSSGGAPLLASGPALSAKLQAPTDVAVGADGVTLYVADSGNFVIRKLGADGQMSVVAGTGQAGYTSGSLEKAQFGLPTGVAVDAKGLLYVADSSNNSIRTVTPDGITVQFESGGGDKFRDGSRTEVPIIQPHQLSLAANGDLFFADTKLNRIRVLQANGLVMTVAGSGTELLQGTKLNVGFKGGFADGDGQSARFNLPEGVAVGPDGTLYVADTANNLIRKIQPK
jgi:sugar lactone lactonase YvrE